MNKNTKTSISIVVIVGVILLSVKFYQSSNSISDEDAKFILDASFSSSQNQPKPKNEYQAIWKKNINDIQKLNKEYESKIDAIGHNYIYQSNLELADDRLLNRYLEQISRIQNETKAYYDKLHVTMSEFNVSLGKGELKERLGGGKFYNQELIGKAFYDSLRNFYEFILNHRANLEFTEKMEYVDKEYMKQYIEVKQNFSKAAQDFFRTVEEVENTKDKLKKLHKETK